MQSNFDLYQPKNLESVTSLLRELGSGSSTYRFISGGTDLMPQLKRNSVNTEIVVSLKGVAELKSVEASAPSLKIGAGITLSDLASNSDIQKLVPALGMAALKVANSQIRNQATIGGNLLVDNRCFFINQGEFHREANVECFKSGGDVCHVIPTVTKESSPLCKARFVSDTVPVLLVYNAKLNIKSSDGDRQVALREFYKNDGIDRNVLKPSEFIASIEIVKSDLTGSAHYEKLRIRDVFDFPSLGVAAKAEDGNGIEVSLTGVETFPIHLSFLEKDFAGKAEMISEACTQARKAASPLAQDFLATGYRRNMVEVFVRKALEKVL